MKYKLSVRVIFIVILATLLTSTFISINVISTKCLDYSICKNEEGPVIEKNGDDNLNKSKIPFINT